jgi:DNA-binding NarL/FixJ family response regulator
MPQARFRVRERRSLCSPKTYRAEPCATRSSERHSQRWRRSDLPPNGRAARERFGGLTAQERDVAVLVARGLSNRAVADELVLGERTIESYVSSILNKLGYTSRVQIAAWAVDVGLAKPT